MPERSELVSVLEALDRVTAELEEIKATTSLILKFEHSRAVAAISCLRVSVQLRVEGSRKVGGWPWIGRTSPTPVERGPSGPD